MPNIVINLNDLNHRKLKKLESQGTRSFDFILNSLLEQALQTVDVSDKQIKGYTGRASGLR